MVMLILISPIYILNNRIKRLRIQCIDEGLDFIIELEDTSSASGSEISKKCIWKKPVFRLSIIEVYKEKNG